MTRWFFQKIAYEATRLGFSIGCLAIRLLPRHWIYRLSDALAKLAFVLFHGFRTRSIVNIAVALGTDVGDPQAREIARTSLRNFFRACAEISVTLEASPDELRATIPISGRDYLDAALA